MTSIPKHAYVIETADQLCELTATVDTFLYASDDGPVLAWEDVNGDAWHAIRALTEDDWAAGRHRTGQEVIIDLDPKTTLPLTVLWHNGIWPPTTEQIAQAKTVDTVTLVGRLHGWKSTVERVLAMRDNTLNHEDRDLLAWLMNDIASFVPATEVTL